MANIYVNIKDLPARAKSSDLSTSLTCTNDSSSSEASVPSPSSNASTPRKHSLEVMEEQLIDRPASHVAVGSRTTARHKFGAESHSFEQEENEVWRIHEAKRRMGELFGAHTGRQRALARWAFTAIVAVLTELTCVAIIATTSVLQDIKFDIVLSLLKRGHWYSCAAAFLLFVFFCLSFAGVATLMVAIEPACTGSGIPEVKSYLNGIDLPHILRFKTYVTKVLGIIFAQASGLPLGKEGPMIHIGAIIGSGVSQGKSEILGFKTGWTKFQDFRTAHERRDFTVCGAAAGVAAAFGAPIGGMLFAMEEGCSYWSLKLSWRTFYCAVLTSLLGLVLVRHLPTAYVAQFYYCDPFPAGRPLYGLQDLLVFTIMGAGGGLIGSVFNQLNLVVTQWRLTHVKSAQRQCIEVLVVTFLMALLSFTIPLVLEGNCKPLPTQEGLVEVFDYNDTLRQFTCTKPGHYNELASLYFNPWDHALRLLFHLPMRTANGELLFSYESLWAFFFPYFIMAFLTFGIAVPAGLFIPSLVSGAALGRVLGQALDSKSGIFAPPGVYALMGACAVLGGMTRMTISLSVILLEATGNLYFLIPFMATLMVARWIGNSVNDGIYDMHIHSKKIPFLEPQCPLGGRGIDLRAFEIMTVNVRTLPTVADVGQIYDLLYTTTHNCFPLIVGQAAATNSDHEASLHTHVTGPPGVSQGSPTGGVFGTVSRDTLCALLALRAFSEGTVVDCNAEALQSPVVPHRDIESFFPNFPDVGTIWLTFEERERWIDLRPYCNTAPYMISHSASASRTYRLFRTMGMRHLLVIDPLQHGALVGIITRHELEEEHMDTAEIQMHHKNRAFWTLKRPELPSGRGSVFTWVGLTRSNGHAPAAH